MGRRKKCYCCRRCCVDGQPAQFSVEVNGIIDNAGVDCANCDNYNGTYTLTYDHSYRGGYVNDAVEVCVYVYEGGTSPCPNGGDDVIRLELYVTDKVGLPFPSVDLYLIIYRDYPDTDKIICAGSRGSPGGGHLEPCANIDTINLAWAGTEGTDWCDGQFVGAPPWFANVTAL